MGGRNAASRSYCVVMARKSPALYELIGERPEGQGSGSEAARTGENGAGARSSVGASVEPKRRESGGSPGFGPIHSEPRLAEPDPGGVLLKPGASVRVPVGYLWVGGALVIGLVVGAFMLGHQAAENTASRERQLELASQTPSGDGLGGAALMDPLATQGGGSSGVRQNAEALSEFEGGSGRADEQLGRDRGARDSERDSSADRGVNSGNGARSVTGSGLPNAYFLGGDVSDPRVEGLNYWVIANQAPDEARAISRFLAGQGVATVVGRTRGGTAEVTTLQGFRRNPALDPQGSILRQRILDLGRVYRSSENGATDFSDMWAKKLN